ncbi:D-2-hydroxyacid dehydrogenase [Pseudokineococcus basanitobsidens]|uniref:D-2-hydroxyacid dehydrogenase n=1 Tax=Pseudokineococcus basanitobsidens TaxID=1926649 RepID=A0ABU8RFG1_9ACTN
MAESLRVAVATPFDEPSRQVVVEQEPRVDLVVGPDLLAPVRWPGDQDGDPSFSRDEQQQRDLEELLDGADALLGIPDEDPAALARVVRANPRLRWVHTMAAGGGQSVRAARLTEEELDRVAFTTSAGVHGTPLAEFALLGLLAGAKRVPRLQADSAAHRWPDKWFMGQLSGQTVLVVGLGGIGSEVARLLSAVGTTVVGTSRHGRPVDGVDELVRPEDLADVAGRVDGVVVTLPGTPSTKGLLDRRFFAALREGATFVNVGRGTVVDEQALVAALDDGTVGYAALDVVASEPLDAASPLWDRPEVLISPHTAAGDPTITHRIAALFADNATRLLDGRELRNRVDVVEFY